MSNPTCSIPGCVGTYASRGFCRTHYGRWRKYGDPLIVRRPVGLPLDVRFHARYTKAENGCWIWAPVASNGYGTLNVGGVRRWAHRIGYELMVGPIPEGLELDHLCRTPACVNPDHLEPVTHRENLRRARTTHCKRGHPRIEGERQCRACRRNYMREYELHRHR